MEKYMDSLIPADLHLELNKELEVADALIKELEIFPKIKDNDVSAFEKFCDKRHKNHMNHQDTRPISNGLDLYSTVEANIPDLTVGISCHSRYPVSYQKQSRTPYNMHLFEAALKSFVAKEERHAVKGRRGPYQYRTKSSDKCNDKQMHQKSPDCNKSPNLQGTGASSPTSPLQSAQPLDLSNHKQQRAASFEKKMCQNTEIKCQSPENQPLDLSSHRSITNGLPSKMTVHSTHGIPCQRPNDSNNGLTSYRPSINSTSGLPCHRPPVDSSNGLPSGRPPINPINFINGPISYRPPINSATGLPSYRPSIDSLTVLPAQGPIEPTEQLSKGFDRQPSHRSLINSTAGSSSQTPPFNSIKGLPMQTQTNSMNGLPSTRPTDSTTGLPSRMPVNSTNGLPQTVCNHHSQPTTLHTPKQSSIQCPYTEKSNQIESQSDLHSVVNPSTDTNMNRKLLSVSNQNVPQVPRFKDIHIDYIKIPQNIGANVGLDDPIIEKVLLMKKLKMLKSADGEKSHVFSENELRDLIKEQEEKRKLCFQEIEQLKPLLWRQEKHEKERGCEGKSNSKYQQTKVKLSEMQELHALQLKFKIRAKKLLRKVGVSECTRELL